MTIEQHGTHEWNTGENMPYADHIAASREHRRLRDALEAERVAAQRELEAMYRDEVKKLVEQFSARFQELSIRFGYRRA